MSHFTVYLNYQYRRNPSDSDPSIDFLNDFLRVFPSQEKALIFARSQRLKDIETIYVTERQSNSEKSIFYRTSSKEGYIS